MNRLHRRVVAMAMALSPLFVAGVAAVSACSDDSSSADVCAQAADIAKGCAPDSTITKNNGGTCSGSGEATARCVVNNQEAFCAFAKDPLGGASGSNAFVTCTQSIPPDNNSGDGGALTGESAKFVDDYCAAVAPCCTKWELGQTGKDCRKTWSDRAAGRSIDPSAAAACLAAIRGAPEFCDGKLPEPAECAKVFHANPPGPPGTACISNADCASDPRGEVRCIGINRMQCRVLIPVKEGEACTSTSSNDLDKSPTVPACDPSATCIKAARATQGTCVRNLNAGEPCGYQNGAEIPNRCGSATVTTSAARLYCDGKTCVPPAPLDGKCSTQVSYSVPCEPGLQCVRSRTDAGVTSEKCIPRYSAGQSCKDDKECADDLGCARTTDAGSCVQRKDRGSPCTTSSECKSNACPQDSLTCGKGLAPDLFAKLCGYF